MARTTQPWDVYRVLPHRDVLDCTLYATATGLPIGRLDFEHVPCGMSLRQEDIEDNWCPHCPEGRQTINKAALARAIADRG